MDPYVAFSFNKSSVLFCLNLGDRLVTTMYTV